MICDTCQHDNQPNAKFCSECGTACARRCPSCDREVAPTAKFCDECGTSLTAMATPAPAAASRKRVTALFADLVGSTSFAERVDPEAVRSSLAPYFELLQSTIDDHAGAVVKFLGDGMLALFGVPEISEDDALRAVAAGVELQRRFRPFADDIRERHGVELGLRVGINTGELVIGADDADMVGDVLNTASRLEAACEPGRVLVGEDTWRLTRSAVSYEVLDEVSVKGKADPVATFQVVDGDGANEPTDDATVFVGRSAELDIVQRVFEEAVATSSARLATVIGSPGVGKTRLAREVCVAAGARSFDLRLERRGSTTFAPIADLLRAATGSGSLEDLERLLAEHPERDRLTPVLASFLGHGEARTTEESFWAVRRLLELLAADGPLIVVIDDIQWAEPLFWDLLDHLVEWTAAPVLLLVLARPELRDLRPELTQPGRRVAASVALEGLDRDTTLELAARLLGIDELPAELADRLPESTDGNPLFVRELVQMLVDDGVLARDGERWRLTIDADAIEVPPTILSLLASRVERLPDDERQVVELASVIGTEFDGGTLEAIADAPTAGRLGTVIERLRRKDLIEPSGQWSGDHPVYRFHHVLIRDAAYRRLLKAHRADLHELVGRHVETTRPTDDEADIIVAHHYEQVFRYRTDLGSLDDHARSLAATAATRLRTAAERALDREDLSSAGNAAIRALELLAVDAGVERNELLLIGCEALLSTGDATRATLLVDELHERSADERLSAWADCFRAQMWSLIDAERLTQAAEVTADAAERLDAIGDLAGVAKARLVRASCLARLGRVGDCETELDLALGATRAAGDRRRTVAVLGAAPLAALWGPSPVARAGGRCLDVLRLLRITAASPTVEATSIRCQGMLEALRGRFDSARSKLDISRATARELGLRQGLYETELFAGLVELLAGDAAAAEPPLRLARDGLGRLGIGADAGQAAALLARSVLLQGRVGEADDLATGALASAGQNLQTAITARAVLAEVRAAQGRHGDARELVDEAIAIVAPTDVTLDHALTMLAAARVAATAGDRSQYREAISAANALLSAKGVTAPIDALLADDAPRPATLAALESRITNPAWETLRGGLEAWAANDSEGASIPQDFLPVAGDGDARFDAIAVRGDDLCLARVSAEFDGDRSVRLVVAQVAGGVVQSVQWFDGEQLTDAFAELDRRYLVAMGFATDHWIVESWHVLYSTGIDGLAPLVHPALEYTEHRRYIQRRGGASDLLDSARANEAGIAVIPRVFRLSDRGAVYERTEAESGAPGELRMICVCGFADDLLRYFDAFDPDDLDTAVALFESRHGAPGMSGRAGPTSKGAYGIAERFVRAVVDRDEDAMLALLADDFEWDHQGDGRVTLDANARADREGFVESLLAMADEIGLVSASPALVASRGDDLYLATTTTRTGGDDERLNYVIGEADGSQLRRMTYYDESQRDAAIDELDRRYRLSCGIDDDHWLARNWPMFTSPSAEAYDALLAEDFIAVEHRPVRLGVTDRLVLIDYVRATPSTTSWSIPVIHRLDARAVLFEQVETWADGAGHTRTLMVAEFGDDTMTRLDAYEPDDLDAALARYDEITGASRRPFTNAAWELVQHVEPIVRTGDRDAFAALIADDVVVITHDSIMAAIDDERGVYDKERYLDAQFDPVFGAATVIAVDLIAVRGDELCLYRTRSTTPEGDLHERIALFEVSDGLVVRLEFFAHDQLREAQIAMDRRWLADLGFGDDEWVVQQWDRTYAMAFDELGWVLHTDFEIIDHRPLHFPSGDAATLADTMGTLRHEVDVIIPWIHRISRSGVVAERIERATGDVLGEEHQILVTHIVDDSIRRIDSYALDDLPAALARYEDITRQSTQLTNGAWEVVQAAARAHRNAHQIIAVRGDDLCLSRVRTTTIEGDMYERIVLNEVSDGLVVHSDSYDHDQLREAQIALDRRWLTSLGFADDHPWFHLTALFYDADSTEVTHALSDEFHYVDHRRLGFPDGDRSRLLANHDTQIDALEIVIPRYLRMTDRLALGERIEQTPSGADQSPGLLVTALGADGLISYIEIFDADDDETAIACFDRLHAEERGEGSGLGPFTNAAWELLQELQLVKVDNDRDRYASLFADDFVATTHDSIMAQANGGVFDKALYMEAAFDPVFGPDSTQHHELIAVRGDDWCLFRSRMATPAGDVYERLNVGQVRDGLAARVDVFPHDRMGEAQTALDSHWLATLGVADDHPWFSVLDWYYDSDANAFAHGLPDDFRVVDHRRLTVPDGDRSQMVANVDTRIGAVEVVVPRYFRLTDRMAFCEHIEQTVGGDEQSPSLMVSRLGSDGRIAHVELFEIDDEEAALACFDRLYAGEKLLAPAGPPKSALTNRA